MKTVLLALVLVTTSLGFHCLPKTDLVISSNGKLENPAQTLPHEPPSVSTNISSDPELVTSYKAKVIQDVFMRLKNARGDFNSMRPTLRFVKHHGGTGPAFAQSKIRLIYMEEKAYDICASMGKDSLNALAVILSHELIHVYEKHEWELFFASENSNNSLGAEVVDKAKDDEIQADYLGGFLAYQAGFATFGVTGKLIDKIYSDYGLPSENPNYPTKDERKILAQQSEVKLKKLFELFEMGNLLITTEVYEDALEYYFKVLEDFQSREIYNNLGVLSTFLALKEFAPTEYRFAYPIVLDMKSRLGGIKGVGDKKAYREEKLTEAIDFFQKAQQYDSYYPIAHLNEGCAHALLGISQKEVSDLEWQEAESAATLAIRSAKDNPEWKGTIANAQVLLGILSALEKDTTSANQYFNEALKLDPAHFLANANKNILNGVPNTFSPVAKIDLAAEVVQALPPDFKLGSDQIKDSILLGGKNKILYLSKAFDECSMIGNIRIQDNKQTSIVMVYTIPDYKRPTAQGIVLGDQRDKVLEKYGEPYAFISLSDGSYLRYLDSNDRNVGVIFQFDADKKLVKWGKYRQRR